MFNPISPTGDTMAGASACYRLESGGQECPAEMFGANAPGSTWHMTFDHVDLGPVTYFVPVSPASVFNSLGNGQTVAQPKHGNGGNGGNGGAAATEAATAAAGTAAATAAAAGTAAAATAASGTAAATAAEVMGGGTATTAPAETA